MLRFDGKLAAGNLEAMNERRKWKLLRCKLRSQSDLLRREMAVWLLDESWKTILWIMGCSTAYGNGR